MISPSRYLGLDAYLRINQSFTIAVVAEDNWLRRQLEKKYQDREEVYNKENILKVNQGFRDLLDKEHSKCSSTHWSRKFYVDCDIVYEVNDMQGMPSTNEDFISAVLQRFIGRQNYASLRGKD